MTDYIKESAGNHIVVRKEIGEFLSDKPMETYEEKMSLFGSVHFARRQSSNHLHLDENDVEAIYHAIHTGEYVVDTGLYYVQVGKPLNKDEFLAIKNQNSLRSNENGEIIYEWEFESFENAKPFTKEELERMVPKVYLSKDFIVMENIAKQIYQK